MKLYKRYTYLNLLFISFALVTQNNFINTVAFINSCAVFTSFHSVLLFDIHAFDKIRLPYTQNEWRVVNFFAHIMPVIVTGYLNMEPLLGIQASACSTIAHVAWAKLVHNGFVMNSEYIYMPDMQWRYLWTIALATHVSVGVVLHLFVKA